MIAFLGLVLGLGGLAGLAVSLQRRGVRRRIVFSPAEPVYRVGVRQAAGGGKGSPRPRRRTASAEPRAPWLSGALDLLAEARKRIVQAADEDRLMREVCHLLVASRGLALAWVGLVYPGDGHVHAAAQAGLDNSTFEQEPITWDGSPTGQGPTGVALRENRPQVVADIAREARDEPWGAQALARGFHSSACLPMRSLGQVVGVLNVYSASAQAFDRDEVELLQGVADELGHGLSRIRAERRHADRLRELDAIRRLTSESLLQRDAPAALQTVVQDAADLLRGKGGDIFLCDPQARTVRCAVCYPADTACAQVTLRYGEGAAGVVAESRTPLLIADYRIWPQRARVFEADTAARSLISAPMLWQGQVIGVVTVLRDEQSPAYTPEDLDLLQLFANHAAVVLKNSELIETSERRLRQFGLLNAITRAAVGASTTDELVESLAERMGSLIGAVGCAITLWDPERRAPDWVAASGVTQQAAAQLKAEPGEVTLTESALRARGPVVVDDVMDSPYLSPRLAALWPWRSVLALPLLVGDIWLGAVHIGFGDLHRFTPDEIALCEQAAGLVALAMAKVQAIESEHRRGAALEALRRAGVSLTSSLELRAVLEAILEHALRLAAADDGHIFLYDGQELKFGAARWADPGRASAYTRPRPHGLSYSVARSGQRVFVPDVKAHPLFTEWRGGGGILGLPLKVGQTVLGVMNIAFGAPHAFREGELEALELLADQAAIALQNAHLFERARADRHRLELLYNVSRELASSLDPADILKRAISLTTESVAGRSGSAFLLEPSSGQLRMVAAFRTDGISAPEFEARVQLGLGRGLEGWVGANRKAALVPSVNDDPRWIKFPGMEAAGGSAISAPVVAEDKVWGVMTVLREAAFGEEHLALLETICRQVGLALSNAVRFQQVERRLREQVALQQVAQVINRRLEMQPLVEEICRQVSIVLGYPNVEILLVEGESLVLRAAQGAERLIGARMTLDQGISGRVARFGRAVFQPDVSQDPDYLAAIPTTQSEIVVPLRKGGAVIGVLNVESPVRGGLTEDDLRVLSLLADQTSVAIENASLYDRLSQHSSQLEATVAERTAKLAVALEQAQQADELKTQFVADVSHELRTPLTNIRLYLELLGHASPERSGEYLETLNRETERLVALIEDLLAISRLDAGTTVPNPVPLDLNALARRLVADRRRLFAERKLDVSFASRDDLPLVRADERMLTQVVANLMTNAMNYTLAGGRVAISTGLQEDQGRAWATLTVSDTGLGIEPEELGSVFQRFFRGSASRRMATPGTGLGLAICKEILDRHGGRITLVSQVGDGSAFTLWLPLGEGVAESAA